MKKKLGKRARTEITLVDALAKVIERPELAEILHGASGADPRLEKMLSYMFDPAHSNKKLATMARECGLSYTELVDVIKKHRLAEGLARMSNHVPQVLEDVAEDAKNSVEMCGKCQGVGSVFVDERLVREDAAPEPADFDPRAAEEKSRDKGQVPMECPVCGGSGEVKKQGDAGARKLVFDSLGLTGGRGPLISVQNNTLNAGGEDDLESILAMGKKQLPAQPQVIVTQVKESK